MNKANNTTILILIFLFFFNTQGNLNQNDTIVISLGRACGVAGTLREYNLRNEAYPFDWIVTPFNALYKMLESDFIDFLKSDFLVIRLDGSAVVDTVNNFEFVHDFPTQTSFNQTEHEEGMAGPLRGNFLDYLPHIKEKYKRRIKRFIHACQGEKKVIFIRNRDITMQQAISLCSLLTNKYPELDLLLVLIDDENKISPEMDINHPHIKSFYGPPYIMYENNKATINWKLIFNKLGLISEK